MSDASRQSLKVSREGIVLIKSFEGFRPRAICREDGGWVIGYGHTLSAREGASVSEADAELLLRYDLLPVEKTLNETLPSGLNQHQFDALVSFAFSVGLDRFAGSDVRQRLSAGAPVEAADAMMGWPEPAMAQSALRRRVAERALFTADPAAPVALSDLLSAPLPPPPMVPVTEPAAPAPDAEAEAEVVEIPAFADPRGAAVAALLGEPQDPARPDRDSGTVESLAPSAVVHDDATRAEVLPAGMAPILADEPSASETTLEGDITAHDADVDTPVSTSSDPISTIESEDRPFTIVSDQPPATRGSDPVAMAVARYSPYSAAMVGPLPYLQPASPRETAPAVIEPVAEPVGLPVAADAPIHEGVDARSADAVLRELEPAVEPSIADAPVQHLVLTPLEDAPEPALSREPWSPEQRAEPAAPESGLFGEDLALTQSAGPILGYENEPEAPARFDWSETGAFVIMGAVGLTAFGASMAAFRLASEQSDGGSETTMIAWVLAVIGAACVGVSSFNLYRRWGLPGGD